MLIMAFVVATISALQPARAAVNPDEGMWLANLVRQLNFDYLRQIGLELSAEEIYNPDNASLKDAIVQMTSGGSGFCTGELVSQNGLLFTNHHCGYDAIASQSTTEHNYLDDGFWAKSYGEELPIPGLGIRILQNAYDVTDSIVPKVEGLDMSARRAKIGEIQNRLIAKYSEGGLQAELKSMFYGNQYFIYVYQVFNDVRLVGTPPSAIGKFGGDTDNWMWPRHTGDFSIFRVYADKENNPAEYSAENVPYKPKKFLTVSLDGYKEGDFTMIMGYPGSTERYLTSFGMTEVMTESNPAQIDVFKTVTDVMKADMDKDEAIRIQLASDYASLMNALKLWTTQIDGMERMDAVAIKQDREKAFMKWANGQGASSEEKYKEIFKNFENSYAALSTVNKEFYHKIYSVVLMPSGNFALSLNDIETLWGDEKPSDEQRTMIIESVQAAGEEMWKTYVYDTEVKKLAALLNMLYTKLPAEKYPQVMKDILAKSKGATPEEKFNNWSKAAFEKSVFTSQEKLNAFLKSPSEKKLKKDPLYNYYIELYTDAQNAGSVFRAANGEINRLQREYTAGILGQNTGKSLYPDANFTLRLTYGTVQDYNARDAVFYHWQTNLNGIMEKRDNTNEEFMVPDELYNAWKNKDFGRYADKSGTVPVCFISDNDITGGNSGSPIMNGKGEWIGLAFDGNYEGTPGDYIFDPSMNRTISVDIRYVLFVIDRVYGAQNIISELKFAGR